MPLVGRHTGKVHELNAIVTEWADHCPDCDPVLGPGQVGRTHPFAAAKVLLDARNEEGGLWLGTLEILAEDVPLSELEIRLLPGQQVKTGTVGWVFQCVACDRLGVVFQADRGGSYHLPVLAWPNAPAPETVAVRPAQLRSLFNRMMAMESRVCELEEQLERVKAE